MGKLASIVIGFGVVTAAVSAGQAAAVFDITFDSSAYSAGQQFDSNGDTSSGASTNTIPIGGSTDQLTKIDDFGSTATRFTATVTNGAAAGFNGNYLRVDVPDGTSFTGILEAFSPSAFAATGQTDGTYYVKMDYQRFAGGGPLFIPYRLVNSSGSTFGDVSNIYFDASLQGGTTLFDVGKIYTLGIEYDVHAGSSTAVRYYINGVLAYSGTTADVGNAVGGLSLVLGNGTAIAGDRAFGLDNIEMGTGTIPVPEPASFAGIALVGAGMLARWRKKSPVAI